MGAFRGSVAVAAGTVSKRALRGARYRRLFPDVFVPAAQPDSLSLRSRAAYLLVQRGGGVLSGYSAAELLGASCGPPDAPAEVTCPTPRRPRPGLLVHHDRLAGDEVVRREGLRMTTPLRTAYDLARRCDRTEAVVALDALAFRFPFDWAELRALRSRHPGARGNRRLDAALALADRRGESPMESRMRLALVLDGLQPQVQYRLTVEGRGYRLDLAFPAPLLAVEFDGGHHRSAAQARRDLHREAALARAGWKIIRFDAGTVMHQPQVVAARTRTELAARS